MAPVALGIEIPEIKHILESELNRRYRPCDLSRDKCLAARRPFMVEQNAVGRVHVVCLAVINGNPVGIEFRRRIGATRIEWRPLRLRRLLHLAVKLGGRGLVEPRFLLHAEDSYCFEQPECSDRVRIGRVLGCLETDLHMGLRG